MNCQKASSLLSAYLDRELSAEERRLLRLHLMSCSGCADELQELEQLKYTLGRLCLSGPPAALLPWLRAQIAAQGDLLTPEPGIFIWQFPWFRRTCAIAAILLLFGLSSMLVLPQGQSRNAQAETPSSSNSGALPLPQTNWVNQTYTSSRFGGR